MELLYNNESYIIRGVAFEIYKQFRNAHKEKIYHNAFFLGLTKRGMSVEREKRIDVFFQKKKIGVYVPDLIINKIIIVELKAKPELTNQDTSQFWQYLKSSDYRLGFLINFGSPNGVEVVRRIYDSVRKK